MNLYSIKSIKNLLKEYGVRPNKRLGQNFLVEKRIAAKILKAANLSVKDTLLEIGPGIGTLTRELAKKTKGVIAVEKDPFMVEILKETTKELPNINIVQGDILNLAPTKEFLGRDKEYKVVANLPFYITSPVIRMFLEAENKPRVLVLMVQKEVAQRICAKPPDMSLLSVSVQFYAEPKIVSYVHKSAFWPKPKVDSAILKLVPTKKEPGVEIDKFFQVAKAGFKQPRKQILNNFSQGLNLSKQEVKTWLGKLGIQPAQRAETLSLEHWKALAKSFQKR